MNLSKTLIFPNTLIPAEETFPLLTFFETIHLIQPVESIEQSHSDNLSDNFMEPPFCQVHCPAPLGNDRDRFMHLVTDIKNRKDDYVKQLQALTIMAMSDPAKGNKETGYGIISSLLQDHQVTQKSKNIEEAQNLILWQARLTLKLAEILEQEEQDISTVFATLSSKESSIFNELRGETESTDNPITGLAEIEEATQQTNSPQMVKNRMQAWKQLYNAGSFEDLWLFTSNKQESFDLVLQYHQKITDKTHLSLLTLELPAPEQPTEQQAQLETFRQQAQPLVDKITTEFTRLVQENPPLLLEADVLLPEKQDWLNQWSQIVESIFPAKEVKRRKLNFTFLPAASFSRIMTDSQTEQKINEPWKNCIMALLDS